MAVESDDTSATAGGFPIPLASGHGATVYFGLCRRPGGFKPNQENGVVVLVSNVNCDLGDEQGHAIPISACHDVAVTFSYLEGDVNPDCVVDALDAQAVAFRWGVAKGSLIYSEFMNLEPSGAQADDDIDINDLQFVYGRFGSTCDDPHPPQDPVNSMP